MAQSKAPVMTLEEAKGRFEEWRSNRRGKARIPAELWSAAVEVARKEGINRTARAMLPEPTSRQVWPIAGTSATFRFHADRRFGRPRLGGPGCRAVRRTP